MWPFIIIGLVTGGVYGLAGIGLVLTYKTSGLFNFAHGALATVSAYAFYSLSVQAGLPWPLGAVIAIFVVGPIFAWGFEHLSRRVVREALALQVAATVGVLLIVQGAAVLVFGLGETRIVPAFFPRGSFEVLGVYIGYADLLTFAIALIAMLVLYFFLRYARIGAAMRAVVDDSTLLELTGTNTVRVRRTAWFIGVMFASASGVLLAPLLPLDPTLITLLVVQAFGAAALGAFRSLPLTFLGGLAIGVLSALSTMLFASGPFSGIPPAVPFIVLFIALLVLPRAYLHDRAKAIPMANHGWRAPRRLQLIIGAVLLAVLLAAPLFAGLRLTSWTTALGTVIIFLSLGLLVRSSGQVSLGHIGFAAIGVTAFARLVAEANVPWLLAIALAGLLAIPVGAIMALPAMRLSGLYLAIATFGFGIALYYVFYTQDFMFGGGGDGLRVPRPDFELLATDRGFYYVVLAFMILACAFVIGLTRGRLGRLMQGLADSPSALGATGASTNVTRLIVFCISAFMAAVGGALIGAGQQMVSASSYPPLLSLTYLVLVVIVPGRAPWYAIIAGLSLILVPAYIPGSSTPYWLQILFGVSAIGFAFSPAEKRGLSPRARAAIDRWFGGKEAAASAHERVRPESDASAHHTVRPGQGLEMREIVVRFGGVTAVTDASLTVPTGKITGLIGPNGAGKTTLFNTASGLKKPSSGTVRLHGRSIDHASPAKRARMGLGRTFQRADLFDSLTVLENVKMGYEGSRAGSSLWGQLWTTRRQRTEAAQIARKALEMCGIVDLADVRAGDLSTGQRRLVELARCLSGPFDVLLLDEPSSGLDARETEAFGEILQKVVRERGVGILLVEHDMELVMRLCGHIYVLEFGSIIFEGAPSAVTASDLVRDAYLGDAGEQATAKDAGSISVGVNPGEAR